MFGGQNLDGARIGEGRDGLWSGRSLRFLSTHGISSWFSLLS